MKSTEQAAQPRDERGTRRELYVKVEVRESCDKDNAAILREVAATYEDEPDLMLVSAEVRPAFVAPGFAPDPEYVPEQPMQVWVPQMVADLMKVAKALNAKPVESVDPAETDDPIGL